VSKASGSLLKKRTKKLSLTAAVGPAVAMARIKQQPLSFVFFKKRRACLLATIAYLATMLPAAAAWPPADDNPEPYTDDLILPMPCGGAMAFRAVAVPAPAGPIGDTAIPLGVQGSPPDDYNDGAHGAFLAGPFAGPNNVPVYWIAKYDVTVAQYQALSGQCAPTADGALPETNVSWFDAVNFSQGYSAWLLKNAAASLPRHGNSVGFVRLPTEAEWEYAARGGVAVPAALYFASTWAGQDDIAGYAVAGENFDAGPSPIGSRKSNPLGLYDMLGNVSQWMLDMYHFTRLGRLSGLTGGFVIRGGNYATPPGLLSTSARQEVLPFDPATGSATRLSSVGFRLVIGVATGDDAARAATLKQELSTAAEARIDPTQHPIQALPGLESDTADPVMVGGLQAVGAALTKANASTLDEEIDAATSMSLAIWKIQKDYKAAYTIATSPEFANLQQTNSYQATMKHLALDQDVLNRLVQSYSSLLQSIVVSESPADITQAIAAEQSIMSSQADPRIAFMNLTETFLNQLSQGAFLKNNDLMTAIQSVKISQ